MRMRTNEEIAAALSELAFFAELAGDNPFKVKAVQNGARAVEDTEESVAELAKSKQLSTIKGIGKGLTATIEEFCREGRIFELGEFRERFPATIYELTKVPGLGPKKITVLWRELGVGSLGELEYACVENRLASLKGFGEKTQTKILEGVRALKSFAGKLLLPRAIGEAEDLASRLAALAAVDRVEILGEVRRRLEVVGDLVFLLAVRKKEFSRETLRDTIIQSPHFADLTERSGDESFRAPAAAAFAQQFILSAQSRDGLGVQVYAADPAEKEIWARLVLGLTGSEDFLASLPALDHWLGKTETEILEGLKLAALPPERREWPMAKLKKERAGVPESDELVTEEAIRGVFHAHTVASDGSATLEEMVEACRRLNLEYLGVSEHSQTAAYAGGLRADDIRRQRDEIEKLNARYSDFQIFQGIESDILRDGALDYPDDVLNELDFVIASLHGQLQMPGPEITERVCRALVNPYTTWLGHSTGRLLLSRRGAALDMEKVLEVAAENGKGIELNSNPYRLDLDWRYLPRAQALGVPIGIFPDAHSTGGIADFKYGVWMARKGGLRAQDIVNTKSRKEMAVWLAARHP